MASGHRHTLPPPQRRGSLSSAPAERWPKSSSQEPKSSDLGLGFPPGEEVQAEQDVTLPGQHPESLHGVWAASCLPSRPVSALLPHCPCCPAGGLLPAGSGEISHSPSLPPSRPPQEQVLTVGWTSPSRLWMVPHVATPMVITSPSL